MAKPGILVRVTDLATGDVEEREVPAGEYMVLAGRIRRTPPNQGGGT